MYQILFKVSSFVNLVFVFGCLSIYVGYIIIS